MSLTGQVHSEKMFENQRTNGPVNVHLISGPSISVQKQVSPKKLSKNGSRSTQGHHLYKLCRA